MTTSAQWLEGARPRTLPAALAPVLVGTGAAAAADAFSPGRALLALVVALALQVGVNYANDYSDGVRGTDEHRVGPLRLVGSGPPRPLRSARGARLLRGRRRRRAGAVRADDVVAAARRRGRDRRRVGLHRDREALRLPGSGRGSVFVFFGLVAVLGTTYVQAERLTGRRSPAGSAAGRWPARSS